MKVITDYKELVGKTIAFAHMAQFADQITLATTDGEVLMATFDGDEYDQEISIFHKHKVIATVKSHKFLQEELDKLGIFNLKEYELEVERQRKEMMEREKVQREERERKEYERLKAKFDGQ